MRIRSVCSYTVFLKDIEGHIFNVCNPGLPHPVTDLADLFKTLSSYMPFYHCDAGLLVIFGVILKTAGDLAFTNAAQLLWISL